MNEHIECQWENCSGGQFCEKHSLEQSTCPLTNSSHEKALVRVVKKPIGDIENMVDFIQSLCLCGKVLSSNEIKE